MSSAGLAAYSELKGPNMPLSCGYSVRPHAQPAPNGVKKVQRLLGLLLESIRMIAFCTTQGVPCAGDCVMQPVVHERMHAFSHDLILRVPGCRE